MSRPTLHYVVISNRPDHPVLVQMKKDAVTFGWGAPGSDSRFTILGEDQPEMPIGLAHGFGLKVTMMYEYYGGLSPDDIVLFTDAHDVRTLAGPDEIRARFLAAGTQVLLAGERNCYPQPGSARYYVQRSADGADADLGPYKYVNSGAYIGYVGALRALMGPEVPYVTTATNDQDTFTGIYLRNQMDPGRIRLDTRAEIFQCLFMAHGDLDAETLTNRVTGTRPLVWHGNGGNAEGDAFLMGVVMRA